MVGLDDGSVVRGGFIFLSRDLKHDWRQVDKTLVVREGVQKKTIFFRT